MTDKKPEGWEQSLKDLIAQGKNHKACETELIALYGKEEGKVGASTFGRYKKNLTGGIEVDQGLEALKLKNIEAKDKKPKVQRPPWSKGKQKAADECKLAQLINKGSYSALMPFCKSKALKEEDVQSINLGGAVVGAIQYYVPGLNLDHPIVTLLTRGIMLYLTFKRICGKIAELKEKVKETVGGGSGIKREFQKGGEQ